MSTPPVVTALLGNARDEPWSRRAHDPVDVGWGDATRHRRLVRTAAGRELALQLPRGTFLADGAVLADDGVTAAVVRRPPEPAVVVSLENADPRAVVLLGYLLGNQHAPVEIVGTRLRAPLLTGPDTARRALADLGLPPEDVTVGEVPLAAHGWSRTSAEHREGHHHG